MDSLTNKDGAKTAGAAKGAPAKKVNGSTTPSRRPPSAGRPVKKWMLLLMLCFFSQFRNCSLQKTPACELVLLWWNLDQWSFNISKMSQKKFFELSYSRSFNWSMCHHKNIFTKSWVFIHFFIIRPVDLLKNWGFRLIFIYY